MDNFKTNCPKQRSFVDQLSYLMSMYKILIEDEYENPDFLQEFSDRYDHFVNLWCPTFKEYE